MRSPTRLLVFALALTLTGLGVAACGDSGDGAGIVGDDASGGGSPALDAGTGSGGATDIGGGGGSGATDSTVGTDTPSADTGGGGGQADGAGPTDVPVASDSASPPDTPDPADGAGQIDDDVACVPQCDSKNCGADGCGGSCGVCQGPCVAGQCACEPSCEGLECGSDGCGGTCGACPAGEACSDGTCICLPDCSAAECGDDGCGGSCGGCGDGLTCDAGACQPATWTAVLVQDLWNGNCSSFNASGADITAAALFGPDGELISHFTEVVGGIGTGNCNNNYTNVDSVTGDPGANNSYVALQGGWVLGTFGGQAILPGFKVAVYEFGSGQGGTDEPYQIYLATDLDCPNQPDPAGCVKLLTESSQGNSEVTVP